MKETIKQWTKRLDKVTETIQSSYGRMNTNQLNWKSNSTTWSIAQNIDHIITINESYFPILEDLKKGTYKLPFVGKLPFLKNFMGAAILRSVEPQRKKKIRTFGIWEPSSSGIPISMLDDFKHHQEKLKEQINKAQPFLENRTIIHSPANTKIVYTLEKAFEIIVTHEERHLNQMKELEMELP